MEINFPYDHVSLGDKVRATSMAGMNCGLPPALIIIPSTKTPAAALARKSVPNMVLKEVGDITI